MKTTYHGSCHCKAVAFEVDVDLAAGTGKCNCTFCWKQRMWKVRVDPADFRVTSGSEILADYGKAGEWGEGHHYFCPTCGIATHSYARIEGFGGAFITVQVAALDDLPVGELMAAPVHIVDGLHDDWEHRPAETRHL